MKRSIWVAGAVFGGLAVILGAMGAHLLEEKLSPEMLSRYATGAEYQMYHALFLLAMGAAWKEGGSPWLRAAGILAIVGILLFSGSLYAYAFSGVKAFGMVTPFGGLSFISAWICLAVHIIRTSKES